MDLVIGSAQTSSPSLLLDLNDESSPIEDLSLSGTPQESSTAPLDPDDPNLNQFSTGRKLKKRKRTADSDDAEKAAADSSEMLQLMKEMIEANKLRDARVEEHEREKAERQERITAAFERLVERL
jgi:hypothetical protein